MATQPLWLLTPSVQALPPPLLLLEEMEQYHCCLQLHSLTSRHCVKQARVPAAAL